MHMRSLVAPRALLAALVLAFPPVSVFGQASLNGAQQAPAPAPPAPQPPAVPAQPPTPAPAQPATPAPPQAPGAPSSQAPPVLEQRGGGPVRKLTIDEAVQIALEQNLDVQIEKINPQIQDFAISQARSVWAPVAGGQTTYSSNTSAPDSLFSGAQDSLTSKRVFGTMGIDQILPFGTTYSIGLDMDRQESNNIFSSFNPRTSASFSFNVNQPLLRGLKIDGNRATYLVQKKNREISDVQLRQQVVTTSRQVRNAYWDLVGARQNLVVAQASLDLARQQLRDNRTRVEVGTMAPIDIVQAEAEVARNEEATIIAAARIDQVEDQLRALLFDPKLPEFWTLDIETADAPQLPSTAADVDVEAAVQAALEKRTDLIATRKSLEATEINLKFYRDQTLPGVNATFDYGLTEIGGVNIERRRDPNDPFAPGEIIRQVERNYGNVLGDLFGFNFPRWTVGLVVNYPLGTSTADANLARNRLLYSQQQLSLRNTELAITTEVRSAGRSVNTNRKRVESTRAARVFSERQLEAAQKKFAVGLATSLDMLIAQRDLTNARNNELNAIIDYVKSLVDFEAVQEAGVGGGLANVPATGGGGTNNAGR